MPNVSIYDSLHYVHHELHYALGRTYIISKNLRYTSIIQFFIESRNFVIEIQLLFRYQNSFAETLDKSRQDSFPATSKTPSYPYIRLKVPLFDAEFNSDYNSIRLRVNSGNIANRASENLPNGSLEGVFGVQVAFFGR